MPLPEESRQYAAALFHVDELAAAGDADALVDLMQLDRRSHNDALVQAEVVRKLQQLNASDAATLILDLLEDDVDEVRIAAIHALAAFRFRPAIPALLQLAREEDADVRHRALEAIGMIGDPSAVPVLTVLLEEGDRHTAALAAMALASIGGERSKSAVSARLQRAPWVERRALKKALRRF